MSDPKISPPAEKPHMNPYWVLFPNAPAATASAKDQIDFARRAAVAKHFGGTPQGAAGSTAPAAPVMPKLSPPTSTDAPGSPAPAATPNKKKEGC